MVAEFEGEKFLKKLAPLVTNGLKGEGMSGNRISSNMGLLVVE